jgi:hypothetical protein
VSGGGEGGAAPGAGAVPEGDAIALFGVALRGVATGCTTLTARVIWIRGVMEPVVLERVLEGRENGTPPDGCLDHVEDSTPGDQGR